MVFSSHLFLFYFLPFALALYYAVPKGWRMPALTFSSYAFYGWTNPWFALLILWSTLVDFTCGNLIYGHWRLGAREAREPDGRPVVPEARRRLFLAVSIASNLGMLCFFKYSMFAAENLNRLLSALGKPTVEVLRVALPAGI